MSRADLRGLWLPALLLALSGTSALAEVRPGPGYVGLSVPPPPPAAALRAGVAEVARGSVSCAVRASREVRVAAPVSGVVAQVAVRPGQRVQPGDLLAEFDTRLIRAELALAQAKAEDASLRSVAEVRVRGLRTRYERLNEALKSRAVSVSEVETARLELDLALGELDRAAAELRFAGLEAERVAVMAEKSRVLSPVAGMVGEVLINPGESPDSQTPIAVVVVTDPLRVEAWVPAAKAPALLAAPAHFARIGGERQELIFDYAAPAADMSSGTISFFYTLRAPHLLPGLECALLTPDLSASAQP